MALQDFDAQQFLDRDWQHQTRVLRAALPGFICPVDGDDLAGLACEADVDSRLVCRDGDDWLLRHGPLEEADFAALPERDWTLLVQSVDHWIPEVADLLEHFRFLPRWRIDDIMISYASDGGSVGPHYDHYDVFLIQGQGKRRWDIGQHCDDNTLLLGHPELRLLKHFESRESVLLEPGDILYIPPGVAHWGRAEGDDCITLSVGFRAPSHSELISQWSMERESTLGDQQRFTDSALRADSNPGWIPDDVVNQLRQVLSEGLDDNKTLSRWFGQLMSHVDSEQLFSNPALSFSEFQQQEQQVRLYLRPGARLAFDACHLFVDGCAYPYDSEQRQQIAAFCAQKNDDIVTALTPELRYSLYQAGTLYFDDDIED